MNLAGLVSRHSRGILVLVFLLCCSGVYSLFQIPAGLFPNTNFPRIVLLVDNGVVPAELMAATVTKPIEEAMNGIANIKRIKSVTSRGSCEINLFFDWKADMVLDLQLVQARLSRLALPPTATIRRLERLTFAVFPVTGYSLTSPTLSPQKLRELAQYEVRPRLTRLPGVADVALAGGKQREFHLLVDPEKLAARGVSIVQVADAVRNGNTVVSPGLVEDNHQLTMVLMSGMVNDPQELLALSVATVNGHPVAVGDVARLSEGVAPEYTIVTADGQPAVTLSVLRQPTANILSVTDSIKNELKSIRANLPADVKIVPFYDQSLLVRDSMTSVRDAILLGLLLSVVILFLFLQDLATTFLAVLVIPVTVLITFSAMHVVGLTFDLMTLGGVAAAIGLVIDDAIVVVENIHTHLNSGQSGEEAVATAIAEITAPLVGSTLTPVVVFVPLLMMSGVTGVFLRSLSITMTVALLTSLFLALLFTPVLARLLLKPKPPREQKRRSLLGLLLSFYGWVLRQALRFPLLLFLLSGGLVLGAISLYKGLPSEFLPAFDEGAFVFDYTAPPGTSLSETDRLLRQVEFTLRSIPEVESYSRRTGLQLGGSLSEPNVGDFLIKLKPNRKRKTEEVVSELRARVAREQPALRAEFAGILVDLIGDLTSAPQPIEIRLFSEDRRLLQALAQRVEKSIQKIPGIVDTFNGIVVSGSAITFQVDPERSARLGVSVADLARSVTAVLTGEPATSILQGDRLVNVRVLYPKLASGTLEALQNLLLRSSSGAGFRLSQVADVKLEGGLTEVERDGLRQSIAVTGRLENLDLGSAVRRIQGRLDTELANVHGISVEYGGLYEEQQSSFHELAMVLALAIVLIFLVLVVEFRSFLEPIAIVTGAVLSLVGVLLGLWVTGKSLNVVSLMGAIMVVGIVAKNGILMLDAVETHLAANQSLQEALLESGKRRFRPVLMTSLAAVLGMLPLALALGTGSEMLQPLAIAVIGGLSVSSFFSLLVTPTVFFVLRGRFR